MKKLPFEQRIQPTNKSCGILWLKINNKNYFKKMCRVPARKLAIYLQLRHRTSRKGIFLNLNKFISNLAKENSRLKGKKVMAQTTCLKDGRWHLAKRRFFKNRIFSNKKS
jgi:hypothetical protein